MPSKIEWTDETWNPVLGCTKVSPGCLGDHCYAERITERFGRGPFSEVTLHPERLEQPKHWLRPRLVFTCSMSDLFHSRVPWDFLLDVFQVMACTPQHTYQVLTKRPGRMAHFASHVLPMAGRLWPSNVWAGTSVESQRYAHRLDVLARVPAPVRFVSAEPLLGPLDLRPHLYVCGGCGERPCACTGMAIQWCIVGGESGPGARPMNPDWVRDIRGQCDATGLAFFFKQWGGTTSKAGGRTLDGCTHDEMPSGPGEGFWRCRYEDTLRR